MRQGCPGDCGKWAEDVLFLPSLHFDVGEELCIFLPQTWKKEPVMVTWKESSRFKKLQQQGKDFADAARSRGNHGFGHSLCFKEMQGLAGG